ncbi:hypothetical protein [Companilactobacillus versmoldensis]|nr:hypothetical protein [Companilactobacillus versmoldensis]
MKSQKPFYKVWLFWVASFILLVATLGMLKGLITPFNNAQTTTENKTSMNVPKDVNNSVKNSDNSSEAPKNKKIKIEDSAKKTSEITEKPKSSFNGNSLNIDDKKVGVIDYKEFPVTLTDSSWQNASMKINSVKVFKIEPYEYDDTSKAKAQGMVIINMDISAYRDISTYPEQGTLITNDGQQSDGAFFFIKGFKNDLDGDIGKGVHKQGDLFFPIDKLTSISDLTKIRLQFDASYETDDEDDEDYSHDYDINLELK